VLHELLEQRFRRVGVGYSFSSGPLVLPWMSGLVVTLPAEDPSKVDLGPFLLEEVARVREGKVPAEWRSWPPASTRRTGMTRRS